MTLLHNVSSEDISLTSLLVLCGLWAVAHLWGCFFKHLLSTPPLLGYLLAGICFRNVGSAVATFAVRSTTGGQHHGAGGLQEHTEDARKRHV
ncbi:unnamed protein product, partial [Amoebophrya sp. A25]|eukprot:GSA25T00027881001.1